MPLGLSPRGRGNRPGEGLLQLAAGSIPAWAGQPPVYPVCRRQRQVYPRVGGATSPQTLHRLSSSGLSPRGRGNPIWFSVNTCWWRSIPAWAGQPSWPETWKCTARVYPRVGGATASRAANSAVVRGLSPRGRGNHKLLWCKGGSTGSIPAWAGQPVAYMKMLTSKSVYPRVGGATGRFSITAIIAYGLSPRGRGNLKAPWGSPWRSGSIPAWAGQPQGRTGHTPLCTVYPRVGGATEGTNLRDLPSGGLSPRGRGNHPVRRRPGLPPAVYPRVGGATTVRVARRQSSGGLSPRGRGNQTRDGLRPGLLRSIPAWAGQP